jgi:hypothetical protein
MSNPLLFPSFAFVLSLSCALVGCVELDDDFVDDGADKTAVTEQAIYLNEVRLRRIQASVLEEGSDEIYMTASQSSGGGVNIIRPSGDPDYWRFDEPGTVRTMNEHVGTIIPGSLLIVYLKEQDGGPHHNVGTIDFLLDHNLEPDTFNTPTAHFIGIENGLYAVRFTNGARYKVWFQIGQ